MATGAGSPDGVMDADFSPGADMQDDYRAAKAINATAIKAGARSMKHMHHVLTGRGIDPAPAMSWGTLVHEFALGSPAFVVYPGTRRGNDWDAFQEAHKGTRIIIESERQNLLDESGLVRSLLDHPHAGPLINGAIMETAILWEEPGIGPCKALPDAYNAGHLSDLKTCQSVAERDFSAASWRMGYHLQLAWYKRGCLAIGRKVESVSIIAIESGPPFDIGVYRLDPLLLDYADSECLRIARRYVDCRDAGAFPGQHAGPLTLLQPQWADEQVQAQFEGESLDPSEL